MFKDLQHLLEAVHRQQMIVVPLPGFDNPIFLVLLRPDVQPGVSTACWKWYMLYLRICKICSSFDCKSSEVSFGLACIHQAMMYMTLDSLFYEMLWYMAFDGMNNTLLHKQVMVG